MCGVTAGVLQLLKLAAELAERQPAFSPRLGFVLPHVPLLLPLSVYLLSLCLSLAFPPQTLPPSFTPTQFWADPLIWGYDHRAQDAAECCAACHAYNAAADRGATEHGTNSTRCNTWSYADNVEDKKRNGECWWVAFGLGGCVSLCWCLEGGVVAAGG